MVRKGLVHRRIVDFLVQARHKPFFDPIGAKVKEKGSKKTSQDCTNCLALEMDIRIPKPNPRVTMAVPP